MTQKTIAVVLAGAVARGAFEAGVIRALAEADVRIVRIVAASSGALNGTLLASAVRNGNVQSAADALHALWLDHASWTEVFHAKLGDLVHGIGVSDQTKLLKLLRDHVVPSQPANPAPISLRIMVAPLRGTAGQIADQPATTYEAFQEFSSDDFATAARLEPMFAAATASAAFPVVFSPVELPGLGPCIDGGTVNNTPIAHALESPDGSPPDASQPDASPIDAIVVVSTSVEDATAPAELHGLGLIGHLAEMLIDERLYRDLHEAADVNRRLAALDQLVATGQLTAAQRALVVDAIGWTGRRQLELVRIRPVDEIPGNAFSGFFDRDVRADLLEAGYQRGQTVLSALGWLDQ